MTDIETALNFHKNGKLDEAENAYTKLLDNDPENFNTLNLLGVLKMQRGKLDEAVEILLKAVELNPSPAFCDNLGLAYYLRRDYLNAVKYFTAAVEQEPYKDTIEKLIDCYRQLGNKTEAIKYLKILWNDDKNNLNLIREIAQLADSAGDIDTALTFYKNALKLEPKDYIAENNLGLIYEKLSNFSQAKYCYLQSLKIKNNFEALKNLGVLYRKEKDYKKSEDCLKKALVLKPDDADTHLSLGMTYLVQKKFNEGYKHYYLKNPDIKKQYKNAWNGTKHMDAGILIFCDGGFGDYIMFSRYIPKLQEYFSSITLLVPPELESLFKYNFPFTDVRVSKNNINYNYSASVMDLPCILGEDFENIPGASGYLQAQAQTKTDLFKTDKLKAGLFWHGNQRVHKNRSIPFELLEPLTGKDVQFYSFQKDDEEPAKGSNIINLAPFINNFYDTACAMKNLDLMITIDSACVHLAGALGVKTFLLLPFVSEWRWFSDNDKTPWYDSVKIFKQTEEGCWRDVIAEAENIF